MSCVFFCLSVILLFFLFICFFFFFKQKTAYEMRISDWSSDVCSSDLGDANRNALRYLHPVSIGVLCRNDREFGSRTCANALDMPLQLQVRIGVPLDLRGLVHLHVVKLRFLEIRFDPAFLDIGRTSCRERGCQSGLI